MNQSSLGASHFQFLLLLSFFISSCFGQNGSNDQQASAIDFSILPGTDEQIGEYVVEIFEDSKGNLWFGTMAKGAARFDGKNLTYFSQSDGLPENTVVGITEDQSGNLWFGSHSGVSKYDGKSFTSYSTKEGLHGAGCSLFEDSKGNLWAKTNHGVFLFDEKKFEEFPIPTPVIEDSSHKWEKGKIWSLMEDSHGNMWFGRDGLGACKYDGESFVHFTKKDGLCSNNVSTIVEDDKGNIWFGCLSSDFPEYVNEGGLCFYDGKEFVKFTDTVGLQENDIYMVAKDKGRNIWIGAIGVGAYRYDGESFTLFEQTNRRDLTHRFGIQSFLEDKNGKLWFGFSGGLFRFDGETFINVTQNGPWE